MDSNFQISPDSLFSAHRDSNFLISPHQLLSEQAICIQYPLFCNGLIVLKYVANISIIPLCIRQDNNRANSTHKHWRNFVEKVFNGNAKGLLSALISYQEVTQEDLEALQRFWEKGGDFDE